MDQLIFGTSRSTAGASERSAAEAAHYDRTCERMWELLSSFLAGHLFYSARENAVAEHIRTGRKRAVVDCYQAALAVASGELNKNGAFLEAFWKQFYNYARETVESLKHDTEIAFMQRVAQAYTPVEHLAAMSPQRAQQFTLAAFKTVSIRAHEQARRVFVDDVLCHRESAIDEMRNSFNGISRAHRLTLGADLNSRGKVQGSTPYDDAARHIHELTLEVRRLTRDNERLKQKIREAEFERPKSTATAELLTHAQGQLAARERLAQENARLRGELTAARSTISSLQDDARTLLNVARLAGTTVDEEIAPDDSVSVRGDRALHSRPADFRPAPPASQPHAPPPAPAPAPPHAPTPAPPAPRAASAPRPSDAVSELMSGFDAESQSAFERDFS